MDLAAHHGLKRDLDIGSASGSAVLDFVAVPAALRAYGEVLHDATHPGSVGDLRGRALGRAVAKLAAAPGVRIFHRRALVHALLAGTGNSSIRISDTSLS